MDERPTQPQKFVVESVDLATRCITGQIAFAVGCQTNLIEILSPDLPAVLPHTCYAITLAQLDNLKARFNFDFSAREGDEITVRYWHWLDELPYKVHTGRELTMMLANTKPLSVFAVFTPEGLETDVFSEAAFDAHVEKGALIKHQEYVHDDTHPSGRITIRDVFYALKDERWRIDAFLLLRRVTRNIPWNDSFELIEGSLLGYSESENTAYLRLINSCPDGKIW